MQNPSKIFSTAGAVLLHGVLILLLIMSFETTISIPAQMPSHQQDKPIIDAVMVNNDSLKAEVQRLESLERKKRQQEQMRQQELARKEQEAKVRRQKEEALAAELQKKNEELKKEALRQELAQKKLEQERQAKLKEEQAQLEKIKKEKEAALVAKKKIEEQQKKAAEQRAQEERARQEKAALEEAKQKELAKQKAAEEAATAQANARIKEDQISRHAALIQNKIHQYWRQPLGFDFTGFTCKIVVKLLPTGEVLDVAIIQSSGNLEYDRSAELAVRKASPLPMPNDVHLAKEFRNFSFTFYPEGA